MDATAAGHAQFYLITHPDVVISREVPVPRWPLSERGLERMRRGLRQPWLQGTSAIYCSTEQKAIDAARILGDHLGLPWTEVEELGENDRSATGFLPPPEFEQVANAFFADPTGSVRGWERACDAQSRMVRAVEAIRGGMSPEQQVVVDQALVNAAKRSGTEAPGQNVGPQTPPRAEDASLPPEPPRRLRFNPETGAIE